jgi:hypothetical protein
MAFEREELRTRANERLPWHEKLDGEDCIQKQVHELISVGNLEAAVSLLLSSAPDSPYFYPNALRAVALASAVSKSLLDLALKVSVFAILDNLSCPCKKIIPSHLFHT